MSSSLTGSKQKAVLIAIETGATRTGAAAAAGIDAATFYRWLDQRDFRDAVREAEGRFELAMVRRIRVAAGKGSWQAALTLLARRLPDAWGERQRVDMTVETSAADRIAHEATEEELERLLADVVGRRSGPATGADDPASET